jgi:hypothetical protein
MTDTGLIEAIAGHKIDVSFVHDGFDDCIRVTAFDMKTGELLGGQQPVNGDAVDALRKAVEAVVGELKP